VNRSEFAKEEVVINEYQSLNHAKWECKFHIVWIPEYRKKGPRWSRSPRQYEERIKWCAALISHRVLHLGQRSPVDLIRGPVVKPLMAPEPVVSIKPCGKRPFLTSAIEP
jgi:hypothetical protein